MVPSLGAPTWCPRLELPLGVPAWCPRLVSSGAPAWCRRWPSLVPLSGAPALCPAWCLRLVPPLGVVGGLAWCPRLVTPLGAPAWCSRLVPPLGAPACIVPSTLWHASASRQDRACMQAGPWHEVLVEKRPLEICCAIGGHSASVSSYNFGTVHTKILCFRTVFQTVPGA